MQPSLWRRQARSIADQEVVPFTGEGAYHGSTRKRTRPARPLPPPPDEMRARTLDRYDAEARSTIGSFTASFPNLYEVVATLPVPTQDEIRDDGVTFCWCPLELALQEAGPLLRRVLDAMIPHLDGGKEHVYIDAKIQYFAPGDVPVDSQHWHLDGTIVARGDRVERLGHRLLHDLRARLDGPAIPPTCLAYQSSAHCATRFVTEPVHLEMPELVPNFDGLDARIRALSPASTAQPASSIVRFDGRSLHRADAATAHGWRLWVRCFETDREVLLTSEIIDCYATVFRT